MAGTSKGNKGKTNLPAVKAARKKVEKATQFGQPGASYDPVKSGYPRWSIRKAQRCLAAQDIDPFDPEAIKKLIGDRNLTIAETIAIRMIQRAFTKLDDAEVVTNNIEGKLKEVREYVEPVKRERGVKSKTIEEAQARLDELNRTKG